MTAHAKTASIIIPTYKRPDDIIRALKSVCAQDITGCAVEIIVADNDPAASAKDAVTAFITGHKNHKITYKHVPEPGVSNARNGALGIAKGRYIIFLDDDMEAREGWAQALLETSTMHDAALCFGPIEAVMPEPAEPQYPFIQPMFSRECQEYSGLISETFGTGGCLIDRERVQLPSPVFDPSLNEVGGEDNALFDYLLKQNINVAWAAEAATYEHVPAHRATRDYVWKRQFAFGQSPSQDAADGGLIASPQVLKWMLIGCGQTVVRFPKYILLKTLNRPGAISAYASLAQAMGKIFWWGNFIPKLYGSNAPG